jgi:hypothetical protein
MFSDIAVDIDGFRHIDTATTTGCFFFKVPTSTIQYPKIVQKMAFVGYSVYSLYIFARVTKKLIFVYQ